MTKQADAKRLYSAVDRLCTIADTDTQETVEWLCGPHGGMSKLFAAYFSPDVLKTSPLERSTHKTLMPTPSSKPLTIKEINDMPQAQGYWPIGMNDRIVRLIRAIEQAHGIGEKP